MPFWRRFWDLSPAARLALLAALLLGVLSFDWQPAPPPGLPRRLSEGHAAGTLRAGAGRALLVPPEPVPIAGLDTRPIEPFSGVADAPAVRALIVEVAGRRVAFVSAELVVVPKSLRDAVVRATAEMKLDELFIGATHTHSGPGGFWDNPLAGWLGTGAFDPKVESFVVAQTVAALRASAASIRPARFSSAAVEASNFASNRWRPQEPIDNRLTVGRLIGVDGAPIANLVIYAAHPTIFPPDDNRLSGDWPGALMATLEADGGPTTLFFQGGVGDVTWAKRRGEISRQDRARRFGQEVASEARGALAAAGEGAADTELDWARVEWALPHWDLGGKYPALLAPMMSNVFARLSGLRTTQSSVVRLGRLSLAMVPGELVSSLDLVWSRELSVTPVSLVDDYIGAIESPAVVEEGAGEAAHSYFGPALATGVLAALREARPGGAAAPSP